MQLEMCRIVVSGGEHAESALNALIVFRLARRYVQGRSQKTQKSRQRPKRSYCPDVDNRYKLRIVFKSGHTETFVCSSFTVTRVADKIQKISWSDDISPKIMQIDCDEIAAVLELSDESDAASNINKWSFWK